MAELVILTLDASSTWILTGTSHINGLITNPEISGTSVSNITGNGYYIYYTKSTNTALGGKQYSLVNGGYLLPEGETVGIEEIESSGSLALEQNYPNSVTASTLSAIIYLRALM